MNELISIIVPIYNSERYLERCIKSILNQQYKNIELILVNDGSTDGSLNICERYCEYDSRIKVINKENQGVSAARNSGLDSSSGKYISFVDSDDYVQEGLYQKLLPKISKNIDVVALTSYSIKQNKKLMLINSEISGEDAIRFLFKLQFPTSLWAYLYSRRLIDDIRLNTQIHFFEDFEFNFNILKKANKVAICNEKLYCYEINELSINSQSVSDKKMTCLGIHKNISTDEWLRNNNHLYKVSQYFKSHFLISMLVNIAKTSSNVNCKYYDTVQNNSREMLKEVLFSFYVPVIYKILIIITAKNPKFSVALLKMRKKLNV